MLTDHKIINLQVNNKRKKKKEVNIRKISGKPQNLEAKLHNSK